MNGIENIVARIGADAGAEADAIRETARTQAQALLKESAARAEAEKQDILSAGKAQADLKEERLVNAARLEAKKGTLAAKQRMVDAAFAKALEDLKALPGDQATDLLARLAAGASSTGAEQVILSEKDREERGGQVVEKANALLKGGRLTLSADSRSMAGGVILKDGRVETNCSFEVLLHLQRSELTADVAGVLFG